MAEENLAEDWESILKKPNSIFALQLPMTVQSISEWGIAIADLSEIRDGQPRPTSSDFDLLDINVQLMRISSSGFVSDANGNEEHKFTILAPDTTHNESLLLRGRFWAINDRIQFFTIPSINGNTARFTLNVIGTFFYENTEQYQNLCSALNARNERLGLTHPLQRTCPICQRRFFPKRSDQMYDRSQCANAAYMRRQRADKKPSGLINSENSTKINPLRV